MSGKLRLNNRPQILNVDQLALDKGPPVPNHGQSVVPDRRNRRNRAIVGHQSEYIPFDAVESKRLRVAHTRSVFSDRIQHRLNFGRRTGDDAEDFTRRCLLLQASLSSWNNRTFSMAITA